MPVTEATGNLGLTAATRQRTLNYLLRLYLSFGCFMCEPTTNGYDSCKTPVETCTNPGSKESLFAIYLPILSKNSRAVKPLSRISIFVYKPLSRISIFVPVKNCIVLPAFISSFFVFQPTNQPQTFCFESHFSLLPTWGCLNRQI